MDCAPESFSSYLSVCVCARERDHLSSPAKSAFKPALSLSSSCVFPNAATFCVFRAGSAKGSCRRTSCSRNFRARPFFFFRREAAEVMTELRFEDVEGMAPLHRAGPRAVPKGSGSGALPDPAEAVREVTASPPLLPFSVPDLPFPSQRSPSQYGVPWSGGGCISAPHLPAGEEKAGLFAELQRAVEGCEPLSLWPRLPQRPWDLERCPVPQPVPAPLSIAPPGAAVTRWFAKLADTCVSPPRL